MSDKSDPSDRASLREEQMRTDAVANARRKLADQAACAAAGGAVSKCDTCNFNIPVARRRALPGVRLCVDCARDAETLAKSRKRP
jgi:phage/conjugal plasmid C-4 type zinc finger TraR family protein